MFNLPKMSASDIIAAGCQLIKMADAFAQSGVILKGIFYPKMKFSP